MLFAYLRDTCCSLGSSAKQAMRVGSPPDSILSISSCSRQLRLQNKDESKGRMTTVRLVREDGKAALSLSAEMSSCLRQESLLKSRRGCPRFCSSWGRLLKPSE